MLAHPPEITALLAKLRLALCCAPLTVTLGCTDGNQRVDPPAKQASTSSSADTGVGTSRAGQAPPEEFDFPACPSGEWCGSAADVEPFRVAGHQLYGETDLEDCPVELAATEVNTPEQQAKLVDLPLLGSSVRLDVEATKAKRAAGEADTCCYDWMEQCPGGRPLLDHGQPQLAPLRPRSSAARWTAALPGLDRPAIAALDPEARQAIAAAWLSDARMEHSSIASFARAGLELRAVDAPAGLIEGCARAAVDERRHTRICFGLAAAYGGPALEPGPRSDPSLELRPRRAELIQVAIDTFIEGCMGETVAAACLRRAASEALDPALAAALARMADDEGDHAALAWQTLAWALARGGAPVRAAIVAIAHRLSPTNEHLAGSAEPEPEPTAELRPGHGRLTPTAQARVRREAWAGVIAPLLADLTRP